MKFNCLTDIFPAYSSFSIPLILFLCLPVHARQTYSFSPYDYTNIRYLEASLFKKNSAETIVTGQGSIDYRISVESEDAGWYELWAYAADWPTKIFLDNKLLAHTALLNDTWKKNGQLSKVFNIYLETGHHILRFQRLYFPGLPYIHHIQLQPSKNISGQVRATPEQDRLVFRLNELFSLNLNAQKSSRPEKISITIRDTITSEITSTIKHTVPSGSGIQKETIPIPTNKEGVFDLEITNPFAGYVDRTLQYVVIDTEHQAVRNKYEIEKELIATIDPSITPPDYFSKHFDIQKDYYESGANGVYDKLNKPDFFAYKLNLPDNSSFYLAEIDYPDDQRRLFSISLVDEAVNPYALDSGVITGGHLPLSNKIQTSQLYFYARSIDPRLLFLNWHSGQKIAVSKIRIFKLSSSLPPLIRSKSGRQFGMFLEEPLRFTTYFGARPHIKDWTEIKKSAERWAEWSRFIGCNLWMPSIANYQTMMWPSQFLPGYMPAEEANQGLLGPDSPKDPFSKDLMLLLLLIAEKNDISFIGELNIQLQGFIKEALDKRFGGNGDISLNSNKTPWLIVSDTGEVGGVSAFKPYHNPLHPEVQKWVKDIFFELANRYKTSSAFQGLAIRLMGWAFPSWQAFPSIHWGYGDYTIGLFEKDTGISVPVLGKGPSRFKLRSDWLTNNHYQDWVDWRCKKIFSFHVELSKILKNARPDLRLYINSFGPDFSLSDWGKYGGWKQRALKIRELGWVNVIKESGIDPSLYKNSENITLNNTYTFEPGSKAKGSTAAEQEKVEYQETKDPTPIRATAMTKTYGEKGTVNFFHHYMEHDFSVKNIGYSNIIRNKSEDLRIVGLIEPPDKLVLNRYLDAMAEGNIVFMTDGGLGYILGQPDQLRPFLKEYHSLPDIWMNKLPDTTDNIAIWYGNSEQNITYFYIVNPSDKSFNIQVSFNKNTISKSANTDRIVDMNNLSLPPYSLQVFYNTIPLCVPIKYTSHSIY